MIQYVRESALDYKSFINEIIASVQERLGENYTVRTFKVTKNNSLELDSLIVEEEGKNFSPNIYLNSYFKAYTEGTKMSELTERICNIYLNSKAPITEPHFSYTFDSMKPFIIYRLVSYEKNKKLLQNIPHIKYLDLAITFHCLIRDDEEGIGTIRITNDHMKSWDTSLQELHCLAALNTPKLFPPSINTMDDVIRGMLMNDFMNNSEDVFPEELFNHMIYDNEIPNGKKMYILTNHKGINGAACLLYKDVLGAFAEQVQSDFYILPSSIHELILVPNHKQLTKESLSDMVKDVNRTQVAADEVLSDKVYYYSRELKAIIL